MTFSVGQLQFIDSLQFLNRSLEKHSGNLRLESLQITKFHSGGKNLELLRRKGVYLYEYINNFQRFDERRLPPKEAFYSSLHVKVLVTKTISMPKTCGKHVNVKSWVTTMTSTYKQVGCIRNVQKNCKNPL